MKNTQPLFYPSTVSKFLSLVLFGSSMSTAHAAGIQSCNFDSFIKASEVRIALKNMIEPSLEDVVGRIGDRRGYDTDTNRPTSQISNECSFENNRVLVTLQIQSQIMDTDSGETFTVKATYSGSMDRQALNGSDLDIELKRSGAAVPTVSSDQDSKIAVPLSLSSTYQETLLIPRD